MTTRYAENTKVTVESSRGDITGILAKHGVQRMGWFSEPEADTLQFEVDGRSYRFRIERPTWAQITDRFVNQKTPEGERTAVDAEWRRRWRANVLLLKAKLEFAEGDASTIARELMPYMLVANNQTLEEAILGGKIPLLEAKHAR